MNYTKLFLFIYKTVNWSKVSKLMYLILIPSENLFNKIPQSNSQQRFGAFGAFLYGKVECKVLTNLH